MSSRLSVIIISWNESQTLKRCLDSFYRDFDFDTDELILVDNGSTDGTSLMVREHFPLVKVLELSQNCGVGPARNRGVMLSTGKYVMTLDNDTIVHCGKTIGAVVARIFESRNDIGVFGFKLLNKDGTFQQSCRRFPGWLQPISARITFTQKFRFFREIQEHHMMADIDFEKISYPYEVDYVLGANQVFRRELFAKVYGYDEKIFFGPEDFDFCFRVKELGLRNYLFDDLAIVHDYQRRTRKFGKMMLKHVKAYYYVMLKNRSKMKHMSKAAHC